ncbi:MAG: hypothetical protein AAFY57_16010 [Cyanobacteria bacterium J06642_2]
MSIWAGKAIAARLDNRTDDLQAIRHDSLGIEFTQNVSVVLNDGGNLYGSPGEGRSRVTISRAEGDTASVTGLSHLFAIAPLDT